MVMGQSGVDSRGNPRGITYLLMTLHPAQHNVIIITIQHSIDPYHNIIHINLVYSMCVSMNNLYYVLHSFTEKNN